jgi:division protein CdvB (Snf7/Vps24/ESCRT-III family)
MGNGELHGPRTGVQNRTTQDGSAIGNRVALHATMQLDQLSQSAPITPLETLVVEQLAQMLRQERALEERYRRLGARRSREDVSSFTSDLSAFDQKAKRLFRMIEAMEGC